MSFFYITNVVEKEKLLKTSSTEMDVVRLFTIDIQYRAEKKNVRFYIYNKNSKFHGEQTHSFLTKKKKTLKQGSLFLSFSYPCGEKLTSPAADCVVMLTECMSIYFISIGYTQLLLQETVLSSWLSIQTNDFFLFLDRRNSYTRPTTYLKTLSPF